jgi:hypothetical protein
MQCDADYQQRRDVVLTAINEQYVANGPAEHSYQQRLLDPEAFPY